MVTYRSMPLLSLKVLTIGYKLNVRSTSDCYRTQHVYMRIYREEQYVCYLSLRKERFPTHRFQFESCSSCGIESKTVIDTTFVRPNKINNSRRILHRRPCSCGALHRSCARILAHSTFKTKPLNWRLTS